MAESNLRTGTAPLSPAVNKCCINGNSARTANHNVLEQLEQQLVTLLFREHFEILGFFDQQHL